MSTNHLGQIEWCLSYRIFFRKLSLSCLCFTCSRVSIDWCVSVKLAIQIILHSMSYQIKFFCSQIWCSCLFLDDALFLYGSLLLYWTYDTLISRLDGYHGVYFLFKLVYMSLFFSVILIHWLAFNWWYRNIWYW